MPSSQVASNANKQSGHGDQPLLLCAPSTHPATHLCHIRLGHLLPLLAAAKQASHTKSTGWSHLIVICDNRQGNTVLWTPKCSMHDQYVLVYATAHVSANTHHQDRV
jgi:hypothetical protein